MKLGIFNEFLVFSLYPAADEEKLNEWSNMCLVARVYYIFNYSSFNIKIQFITLRLNTRKNAICLKKLKT